jgi:hypothetical protein
LYLDLAPGHVADLEVAARTAIAFSVAVKEMVAAFDPWAEVRIELVSGTGGSFSFNGLLKAVKAFTAKHPIATGWVLTMMTVTAGDFRQWASSQIFDLLNGNDAPAAVQAMTVEERQELAEEIAKRVNNNTALEERRQIFREAERDPHIKGLGATGKPGKRPDTIVPRSEFADRAGEVTKVETVERRTKVTTMRVTLVRPVLKNEERAWKFQFGSMPDFGATMKDHAFLAALADGRVGLPLRVGTEMEIEIETKEEREGDIWAVKERSVLKVLKPQIEGSPDDLLAPRR